MRSSHVARQSERPADHARTRYTETFSADPPSRQRWIDQINEHAGWRAPENFGSRVGLYRERVRPGGPL